MEDKKIVPDRKSIVSQKDFIIKKKFSQNFLLDENIINNIIEKSEIDSKTGVIEIGPGLGALTKRIISIAKTALVYEVDKDLIPYLNEFFSGYDNFMLLNQDVLKADINNDIKFYLKDVDKVVLISNLPYHITTPIIMKILEEVNGIDSMILMMQLEVAKRITSKPNTKDYNALSVIIQHQTKAKYLFKVPKAVFYPKPNVDSAVIRLDIRKEMNNNEHKEFYEFVHACFTQRRKTLVNNLNSYFNKMSKDEIVTVLNDCNIQEMARSESLDLNDFLSMFNRFKNLKN